jgi:hypothetical protein
MNKLLVMLACLMFLLSTSTAVPGTMNLMRAGQPPSGGGGVVTGCSAALLSLNLCLSTGTF